MTAPLRAVLYTSTAAEPFDDEELRGLLEQSRTSNAGRDITGMLLYRAGRFVQVLEGPPDAIDDLLARIARDERHVSMRVLMDEEARTRQFAEWTMGYQPVTPPTEVRPAGFRDTFDDLDAADETATVRAARELSMWFRVRSGRPAVAADR